MKQILGVLILAISLVGCSNKKGEPYPAPKDYTQDPPRNLTYPSSTITFTNQKAITAMYPTYYGAVATEFTVSPALPTGIYLSSLSGRIAGLPEGESPAKNYVITAHNANGVTSTIINIRVIAQVPGSLRYRGTNDLPGVTQLLSGKSVVSFIPEYDAGDRDGGAITSFTISPSTLPTGLNFNSSNGYIEGLPTGLFPETTFTVTGTNSGGTVATSFKISVEAEFKNLATGGAHNCIQEAGDIYCWGDNSVGQLGNGNNTSSATPQKVLGLPTIDQDVSFLQIEAGGNYTCATSGEDYNNYCWGGNGDGQLGPSIMGDKNQATLFDAGGDLFSVIALSAADVGDVNTVYHTCGIDIYTKDLMCVGSFGDFDYLSSGYHVTDGSNNISDAEEVTAGGDFACYTYFSTNGLYCFGKNDQGQLGDNGASGAYSQTPVLVNGTGSQVIWQMAAGSDFACFLNNNNEVYCFGNNTSKQLGSTATSAANSPVPVAVEGLGDIENVSEVHAGRDFACVLAGTQVYCWGDNSAGQLGRGTSEASSATLQPVLLEDDSELMNVQELSLGEHHACALSLNKVYCWGDNSYKQVSNSVVGSYNKAQLKGF